MCIKPSDFVELNEREDFKTEPAGGLSLRVRAVPWISRCGFWPYGLQHSPGSSPRSTSQLPRRRARRSKRRVEAAPEASQRPSRGVGLKARPSSRRRLSWWHHEKRPAFTARLRRSDTEPGGEFAPAVSKAGSNATGFPVDRLIAAFRVDLFRRPIPFRPIPDQPLRSPNSNPSTPGHGRVGSRECTACLKSAVLASRGQFQTT
ncbi:hypothetical protein C8D77_101446 [Mesorhizobium loti]|uniref:Uncharacterized protein n=1 Tax=Rhizobium loti TaxID=381 RepID=A0A8E2WJL1_RHILI|nr:hypothetical protein C8D77_101446 [Mesorhizobium loti]